MLIERSRIEGSGHAEVCVVTLNRPKQYNALSLHMLEELQQAFAAVRRDPNVRAVLLSAKGKAFCAGHDLAQMNVKHGDERFFQATFARSSRFMLSLQRLPQPVIAVVDGMATGAGTQLVAACDLAVASSRASFATSGVRVGLFCSTPSVPLTRAIPRKRAFEMLVTGDFIDAHTAMQWGLVNRVVEPDQVHNAAMELVTKIASTPGVAISTGKQFFYSSIEKSAPEAYDLADYNMAHNAVHADTQEGIAAYVEKRKPQWDL